MSDGFKLFSGLFCIKKYLWLHLVSIYLFQKKLNILRSDKMFTIFDFIYPICTLFYDL